MIIEANYIEVTGMTYYMDIAASLLFIYYIP